MSGSRDDDRSIDGVRIHARLIIVMHSNESPVRNHTSNADRTIDILACDEVFDRSGVEELDIGEREDL